MDSLTKLTKNFGRLSNAKLVNYYAYAIFAISLLYIFYCGQLATVGLAVGSALIVFAVTGGALPISLISGSLIGLIAIFYSRRTEAFADVPDEGADDVEEAERETEEGFEDSSAAPVKKSAGATIKKAKRVPPPDNADRKEMFELGKKYKMPEEDGEFHLDAGTTFLNAYKSLKPDQIASMTKDTQELMETQKQLMSTLNTLKPLISDGKNMMDMFQSYFGGGKASLT